MHVFAWVRCDAVSGRSVNWVVNNSGICSGIAFVLALFFQFHGVRHPPRRIPKEKKAKNLKNDCWSKIRVCVGTQHERKVAHILFDFGKVALGGWEKDSRFLFYRSEFFNAHSGRGSLGRLSSSGLPRLGFFELDAAVSAGSASSQLSVVLHVVCPQRRRPLLTAAVAAPAPAAVSSPKGAALCENKQEKNRKYSFKFKIIQSKKKSAKK